MKKLILLVLILSSFKISSQNTSKNTTTKALTFKEIQKQFTVYQQTHDLSKENHWKNYKRWEYETQLHTNGHGEPDGYKDYVDAALEVAKQKQQAESAGAASNWSPTGPNVLPANLTGYMENGIGRINTIAFHPTNNNTYFVGVAQGGLWKTTNNGVSWTPLTDNLPVTRISDICIDPSNPNTMYISVCDYAYLGVSLFLNGRKRHTHYGVGVYKTTDGGINWSPTGLTFQLTNGDASLIKKIIVNPGNTSELVACGVSGMYRSTNSGATWTKKLDSLFWDMVQDPVNPNVLYAATGWVASANIGNSAIYKSTDFGNTWSMLNTGMPSTGVIQRIKLAIAPSDPNYIYAMTTDYSGGFSSGLYGFYKSTNAGVNWTYIPPSDNVLEAGDGTNNGGQGTYDLAMVVHPTDKNTLYTGGVNIWGSSDGANTFFPASHWTTQYGATLHGDIHYLAYQQGTGQYFACTDGGLYRTGSIVTDTWSTFSWPTVWIKLNDGIQITSFYRLSSSKNSTNRLVAGAQDNATFYFKNNTWTTIFGGDGMDNYLDPLNHNNVLGASQYGNLWRSTNNGSSYNFPNSNPNNELAEWVTPIVADYNNPGVIYVGNENVFKSTNGGSTWSGLSTFPFSNVTEVSALAVSNTNSLVLYAAKRVRYEWSFPGQVYKTNNGGISWVDVTAGLPDSLYYTGLEINETNSNIVYICMAGFSAGNKVYQTTNGGTSWTNISYNLPNVPVNCIKQIPNTGNLIVATDLGVYTLAAGATTWVNNSLGLPNVIISDIEFNTVVNKLYVSTFGRGIWETDYSIITDISNNKSESIMAFQLYPVINNGEFTLRFDDNSERIIEIIDVMGKKVHTQNVKDQQTVLNLKLVSGAYYLRSISKNEMGVKKFIVE